MIDIAEHLDKIYAHKEGAYIVGNCYIEHAENSIFDICSKSKFLLGCSWLIQDPHHSILALRKNAALIVKSNFKIYSGAEIYINTNASLTLGSGYINNHLNLHCFEKIEIGNNVAIADNVTIRDSDNHLFNGKSVQEMTQPVIIGDHVWIGTGAIILKGVQIGNNAVIGAGSVVTKNIPDFCLAAGVPARIIKRNINWE